MLRRWKLGMAALLALAIGSSAQGGLLPLSATVMSEGSQYRYTYGVMLTSNSIMQKGDTFAIYDFAGYVPGSEIAPPSGQYIFSTQLTGGTPGRTIPNDDPNLPNLIWTYNGDTPLVGQIGLGNFSAVSTRPESAVDTDFTGRTHVEDPNGFVRIEDNITKTKAPSGTEPVNPVGVPEPSSLILLALGIPLAMGARFWYNRKKLAASV